MKKSKKLKISIGIPAYNEASNIQNILRNILEQKRSGWVLQEILVYSDGSSDDTAILARKVRSRYLKVFEFNKRRGKTIRLSQMFKKFQGEVLLMLDGDIKLATPNTISKISVAFKESDDIMLVAGNTTPFSPQTFFEKSVYSTFNVFYKSRKSLRNGNNIFGATGACLAIHSNLARKINFPKIINEDAFIYFYCLKQGYQFKYVDSAKVYYKLPKHLIDYLRQVFRSSPESVTLELEKRFGRLVEEEFYRPKLFYTKSIIFEFFKNPIGVLFISLVNLACKPLYPVIAKYYKLSWFTASSTH